MLQLQIIRNNPEEIKKRLAIKYFNDSNLVDTIIGLDDERKRLQLNFDNKQANLNSSSKEIGQLMTRGKKEEAEAKKKEIAELKPLLQSITEKLNEIEKQLQDELVKLPN